MPIRESNKKKRNEEYEMRNEMVRRKQHLYIEPPSGNDRANFRTKGDKTMTKTKFRITGVLLTIAMLLATFSSFAIPTFAAEEDGSTDVIDASAMTADELHGVPPSPSILPKMPMQRCALPLPQPLLPL